MALSQSLTLNSIRSVRQYSLSRYIAWSLLNISPAQPPQFNSRMIFLSFADLRGKNLFTLIPTLQYHHSHHIPQPSQSAAHNRACEWIGSGFLDYELFNVSRRDTVHLDLPFTYSDRSSHRSTNEISLTNEQFLIKCYHPPKSSYIRTLWTVRPNDTESIWIHRCIFEWLHRLLPFSRIASKLTHHQT